MRRRKREPKRVRVHAFMNGGAVDHNLEPICLCGSLQGHRVHRVPEVSAEVAEIGARMIGETNG